MNWLRRLLRRPEPPGGGTGTLFTATGSRAAARHVDRDEEPPPPPPPAAARAPEPPAAPAPPPSAPPPPAADDPPPAAAPTVGDEPLFAPLSEDLRRILDDIRGTTITPPATATPPPDLELELDTTVELPRQVDDEDLFARLAALPPRDEPTATASGAPAPSRPVDDPTTPADVEPAPLPVATPAAEAEPPVPTATASTPAGDLGDPAMASLVADRLQRASAALGEAAALLTTGFPDPDLPSMRTLVHPDRIDRRARPIAMTPSQATHLAAGRPRPPRHTIH